MAKHYSPCTLQEQVQQPQKSTDFDDARGALKPEPLEVGRRFVAVLSQICLAYD
jgi:hypothetical protein